MPPCGAMDWFVHKKFIHIKLPSQRPGKLRQKIPGSLFSALLNETDVVLAASLIIGGVQREKERLAL